MKNQIKVVVTGAIVLLVLCGVLYALMQAPDPVANDTTSTYSTTSEVVILYSHDPYSLEKLDITNPFDSYSIESVDGGWIIQDISDYPQNPILLTQITGSVSSLSALRTIELDAQDLSIYGLDSPMMEYTAHFTEQSYTVQVGNLAPDGVNCYGKLADSNDVYLFVDTVFWDYTYSMYDYLNQLIIDGLASESVESLPDLKWFEINRPDLEQPIIIRKFDGSDFSSSSVAQAPIFLESPSFALLDENDLQYNVYGVFGIVASKIIELAPDEETLTEYGFDTPTSTFYLEYNESDTVTITTGDAITNTDGAITHYYVYKEESDMIYAVDVSQLIWMSLQANDVVSAIVTLPPLGELDDIRFSIDGNEHIIDVTQAEGDDPYSSSLATVTLDGKSGDDQNVKTYVSLMLSTSVSGIIDYTPTIEPIAVINYNYLAGGSEVVKVYVEDDLSCYITLNDNTTFVGRQGFVDKLSQELNKLLNGETVDVMW